LNEWAFAAEIKSWWDPDFARHPEWRIDRCEVENASEGSRQRSDLVVLGGWGHTNTVEGVWSLFKRSIVGSYHQLSAKHLQAYLDEMAFRFNNRENPYLFHETLAKLVESENLPYRQLVAQ
jgi:hypothetical protein